MIDGIACQLASNITFLATMKATKVVETVFEDRAEPGKKLAMAPAGELFEGVSRGNECFLDDVRFVKARAKLLWLKSDCELLQLSPKSKDRGKAKSSVLLISRLAI